MAKEKMRNKTYRNFMIIANKLQREKGYSEKQDFELAHKVFENVEADKQYGKRTAEHFYNMILSNSEYMGG